MAPLEIFMAELKIAAIAGVALTFPVIGYQLYAFVAPGLYKRERKAFLPFLLATPFLFALGAALVYFIILPFVMWFSLNQQVLHSDVHVVLHLRLDDYLKIVTTLIFGFGLCFQLPVVLSLLGMAGLVNAKQLAGFRRYAIVAVTALAAVLTPPDPISMMCLAVPLVLLYEISIWCVWLIGLGRKREKRRRKPRKRNDWRLCGVYARPERRPKIMAELSTDNRNKLPKSKFAEPDKKAYPIEDKAHAKNAKARASQAVKAGRMSKAEEAKIDRRADAVIKKH